MMDKRKKLFLIIAVISMLMLSTGCQYLGINSKDTAQESAAQKTGDEGAESGTNNQEGAVGEQNKQSPHAAGPDPDPQSPFAKLKEDEQKKLVACLDLVQASFTTMGQAFTDFQESPEVSAALRDGKSVTDTEPYNSLKSTCQAEIDKITNMDVQGLPESTNGITDSALAVSSWYQQFFNEFENQNDAADLGEWLNKKSDELSQVLQAFLDQLSGFQS